VDDMSTSTAPRSPSRPIAGTAPTPRRFGNPSVGDLAIAIDAEGLAAHEPALRDVADAALRAGLSPVLAAVLADATQPDVARLRAFGLLSASLAATGSAADRAAHIDAAA